MAARDLGRRKLASASVALAMIAALVLPFAGVAVAGHAVVNAAPNSDTNGHGSDHTMTVTTSQPSIEVNFNIESGPNTDGGTASDFECVTDTAAPFECAWTYTGDGGTGTDSIRVWSDEGGGTDDAFDGGEPNEVVTKTWTGAFSLTMTPGNDAAVAGTCNAFTVTLEDSANRAIVGAEIDVSQVAATNPGTAGAIDVGFCTPGSGPNAQATSTAASDDADGTDGTIKGEVGPTDAAGQVSFGVTSSGADSVTVTAWNEDSTSAPTDDNETADADDPADVSTKTWSAGGADEVDSLDAEPEADQNPTSTSHEITATLRNSGGLVVTGITPTADITAGPNAAVTPVCDASDNDGVSRCIYTGGATPGTDTILVWVQQSVTAGGGTPGPDAGEPQDEVTKTWGDAPENMRIVVTCDDPQGDAANNDCTNPTEDATDVFVASVWDANDTVTTTDDMPAEGIKVQFDITAESAGDIGFTPPGAGDNGPVFCTTAADGTCSVTVTNPTPADADSVTVEGTVFGQTVPGTGGDSQDSATKTWEDRAATTVVLEPAADTNVVGTQHQVIATVTDQFADPVAGASVDFLVESGPNAADASLDVVADANGQAAFTYTGDGGTGIDLIRAWVESGLTEDDLFVAEPNDTARKDWRATAPTVTTVSLDMEGCNGNLNNPTAGSWNDTATDNPVTTVHEVCASAFDASDDVIIGQEITLSLTGPGHFTDAAGATNLGTSVTVAMGDDDYAHAFITSTETGTTTVTAAVGSVTDPGTKTWTNVATDARNITCAPATSTNPAGTQHLVTCEVNDRFGNPVGGVTVAWDETGPGRIETAETTTGADGQVEAVTSTTETETGTQTITATITTGGTECAQPAGTPAGAPAGNCADTVTKEWIGGPTGDPFLLELSPDEAENEVGSTHVFTATVTDDTGAAVEGATVLWTESGPGQFVSVQSTTDAGGQAIASVTSETAGDQTITATATPCATGGDCTDTSIKRWRPSVCSQPGVICGTPGDDILIGTAGDDIIIGFGGDDIIDGGSGNDVIRGGGGSDNLRGQDGDDTIRGGKGSDIIRGGAGNDVLLGRGGNDVLRGGIGSDFIAGNDGNDTLLGGRGHDVLRGGTGNDILRGGRGQDTLAGGPGDDRLNGGRHNDSCGGGKGSDRIRNC